MKKDNEGKRVPASPLLVVTSALPYANGDIHLGHLVETVQTDIYVRYKKMTGQRTIYVCADDTHGTPIQLTAIKRGISCEQLIEEAWNNHVKDYQGFAIGFDIFYSTNSPENKYWAEYIFSELQKKGMIVEKEIEQYYCETCARFLPDRFIIGTCPRCKALDQYGDVCEKCGATYDPVDLIEPKCIICKNTPVRKRSKHFFVQLAQAESFLREYLKKGTVLQEDMRNFVMHWIEEGLHEWCISRDGPYFGFKIPHTENKFFYVWLDAPVGYIASTDKWCKDHDTDIKDVWHDDASAEVIHFIGKDIVYFHTLFWPVMLHSSHLKLPSRIFVHGFLTVQGEKMSKTRGTFILARDFLQKVSHPSAPQYLRFYYGSKLTSNAADIDLSIDEFCSRVNTTLINNIGNLHHRTFVFLDRYFKGHVPDAAWDSTVADMVEKTGNEIASHFENVEFKSAVEKIHALGNSANKYYQDMKPWELVKTDLPKAAEVMVTCVNIIKACAVFLKPFIPDIIHKIELQYGQEFMWNDYLFSLRNHTMGKTEKLVTPIQPEEFSALLGTEKVPENGQNDTKDNHAIEYDDFKKVELRVGTIQEATRVKKSGKLLKLIVNEGSGTRQIVAGIGKQYTPETIVGKQIVFVANLKPAKLMGVVSEGMVLAAENGSRMSLIGPDSQIDPGAPVS